MPPGGRGAVRIADYVQGTTAELLAAYDAIAVLEVVSRQAPIAVQDTDATRSGATQSRAHVSANPGTTDFDVVRPAQFALVRTITGSVPSCLSLDVPGGTAGAFSAGDNRFPATFSAGERVLAFFSTSGGRGPMVAAPILRADEDGALTLPFGGAEHINVNTWKPDIAPSPAPSSGGVSPPLAPPGGPLAPPPANPVPLPKRGR